MAGHANKADGIKIVSLNICGGKFLDRLIQFLREKSESTDIFCFQEMVGGNTTEPSVTRFNRGTYKAVRLLLRNFDVYVTTPYTQHRQFLTMFVRKTLKVGGSGSAVLVPEKGGFKMQGSKMLYVELALGARKLVVSTVHGLWIPPDLITPKQHYLDTPERIEQSRRILKVLSRFDAPKVLCGDFNLKPGTRSIAMLDAGMADLTEQDKIRTTRDSLAPNGSWRLTDYMFVSKGIRVSAFKVIRRDVSDHLPLYLRFSIKQ